MNIFSVFSPYADPFEKKVNKFFSKLNEKNNKSTVNRQVTNLLQNNALVMQLWIEWRYRGYKYLKKTKRKQMYANSKKIITDFNEYCEQNSVNMTQYAKYFKPHDLDKLEYIIKIMHYQ